MKKSQVTRREFVQTSAGIAAATTLPYFFSSPARGDESKNNRPLMGTIGTGGQGTHDTLVAAKYADIVAVCDVDKKRVEDAKARFDGKPDTYDDYRKLLDRKDIEAVIIGTPDHWHTKPALDALAAGKHVYCEKPLTLTVEEGKLLRDAVNKSGKVMQVGTQQRSDFHNVISGKKEKQEPQIVFARAVATVRSGQLGKIKRVVCQLPPSAEEGGPFAAQPVPEGLNWDFWLGQAPKVDYCPQRCHYKFRWWYEYSGGVLTDWGPHTIDIAHWALGLDDVGPLTVDGSTTKLPNIANGFNVPKYPVVDYTYPGGLELKIVTSSAGVLFEGENGRIFVDRGRIVGKPIEDQDADPQLMSKIQEEIVKLYKGNTAHMEHYNDEDPRLRGFVHMGNFINAFRENKPPVSDVASHHRVVTSCHIGNISIRLGRKLTWDAQKEEFVGDSQANDMLKRPGRAPYQVSA